MRTIINIEIEIYKENNIEGLKELLNKISELNEKDFKISEVHYDIFM